MVAAGWTPVLASLDGGEVPSEDILALISNLLAQSLPASVGELSLQGTAAWREAGPGADGQAEVRISGQGPTPGKAAELNVSIRAVAAPEASQRIRSLSIDSLVITEVSRQGRLMMASVETALEAGRDAGQVEDVYGLSLAVDQRSGWPQISGSLSQHEQELFKLNLVADAADAVLAGEWAMELSDASIRDLMLGRELPEFALAGKGAVRATGLLDEVNLEGDLNFWIVDVSQLEPTLSGVGDLAGQLSFAVRQARSDTRLTRFDLEVSGAAPVLDAKLLQGVEIAENGAELRVADPESPVMDFRLLGLPMSWIQPAIEPWVIDARPIETHLVAMATPQGLRFMTSSPLRMEDVAVAKEGRTFIDATDIEIDMGAELTSDGWQVELGRVALLAENGPVAEIQARGGRLQRDGDIVKMVGRLEADLARVSAWPGISALEGLSQGKVEAEFGIGLEERLSLATAIAISNLKSNQSADLPQIGLDARVDFRADGSLEVHLPIQIEAEDRSSEMTFNLRGEPDADQWRVEGSLSGPKLYWQDVQSLLDGVSRAADSSTLVTDYAPGPRKLHAVQAGLGRAPWQGVSGTIQTALGEIILDGAPTISRVQGDIVVEPTAVRLSDFSVSVGNEGNVDLSGEILHRPAEAKAYRAQASLDIQQLAVDPWLRWFEPDSVPILEGRVDLDASWQAEVDDLSQLADAGLLEARLSSNGGVLRALGVDVESYIKTGQTVAALGALFGALTKNDSLTQQAERVRSATLAAEQLSLVTFDQLNLNLARLASGDIVLSDLTLISPALRLVGEGRIAYREDLAFWFQPLAISMNLSARDELGAALQQLGLLRAEADALGYLPLVRGFTLDGSLAKIGTAELQNLIVRAFTGR
ncbi:MAG: hypothetical protein SynsKO_12400 [Synoicihabitans sp.]